MQILFVVFLVFGFFSQVVVGELDLVIEIYRHGARGPTKDYWDGKNQSAIRGQLTGTGMRQQEVLGQALRKEYIEEQKFLSPSFNISEIYVFSDDYDRTLTSAFSQLYGLYPPGTGVDIPLTVENRFLLPPYQGVSYFEVNNSHGQGLQDGVVPIAVHSNVITQDPLINPGNSCPNLLIYAAKYVAENLPWMIQYWEYFLPTIGEIQTMLNITFLPLWEVNQVWSVFECDLYNARPLPPGFSLDSQLWTNMSFMNNFTAYIGTRNMTNYNIINNNIFTNWLDALDASVQGKNPIKLLMFSAHDANLITILPGLNITNGQCLAQLYFNGTTEYLNCWGFPQFASNLILELHNKSTIKIKYNGVYQKLCETNQTSCEYTEFRKRLKLQTYPPEQYKQICQGNIFQDNEEYSRYAHIDSFQKLEEFVLQLAAEKSELLKKPIIQYLQNIQKNKTEEKQENNHNLINTLIAAQTAAITGLAIYLFTKNKTS